MFNSGEDTQFNNQLRDIGPTNSVEESWNKTRVEALKEVLVNVFKKSFKFEHYIEFENIEKEFKLYLQIKVITKSFGFVASEISYEWLKSKNIPPNFPQLFLQKTTSVFEKKRQNIINKEKSDREQEFKEKEKATKARRRKTKAKQAAEETKETE